MPTYTLTALIWYRIFIAIIETIVGLLRSSSMRHVTCINVSCEREEGLRGTERDWRSDLTPGPCPAAALAGTHKTHRNLPDKDSKNLQETRTLLSPHVTMVPDHPRGKKWHPNRFYNWIIPHYNIMMIWIRDTAQFMSTVHSWFALPNLGLGCSAM